MARPSQNNKIDTKLRSLDTYMYMYVNPLLMYGSECWTIAAVMNDRVGYKPLNYGFIEEYCGTNAVYGICNQKRNNDWNVRGS